MPAGTRLSHATRSFRHRNFRLFFGGQLVSLIGTWMQNVAQSWLVYRISGSALALGTVGFTSQIPIFLLSPFAGVWADHFPRRTLMILTQSAMMFQAFALAWLAYSGRATILSVSLLSFWLGLANAFDIPARQAFVAEMVGREELGNAIAINSSMFNITRILGPALAGLLLALVGEAHCFFINGLSYLAVIGSLFAMNAGERLPRESHRGKVLAKLAEGYRYIHATFPIKAILLLLGVTSLTGAQYIVLMPLFADRILHGGPRALGFLYGSSGLGALLGALTLMSQSGVKGLGRKLSRASIGFGASLIAFSASKSFSLSVALLLPVGFFFMVQMAASNTLIQSMVPDSLRGRVMSYYSMMLLGMAPFGSLIAGALARAVSASWAVAIGGFCCICGGSAFLKALPRLREAALPILREKGLMGT